MNKKTVGYSRIYSSLSRSDKMYYNKILNMSREKRLKLRDKLDKESHVLRNRSEIITEVFRDEDPEDR